MNRHVFITRKTAVTEGEILTTRDTAAHTLYINLTANFMISFDQGRAITIHHKGDVFGCSSMVSPFKHKGTAVALTRGDVLTIEQNELLDMFKQNSYLEEKIMPKIKVLIKDRAEFN